MTSELKPCPFCGSEAQQRSSVIERGDYGDTIRYNVGCPQCDASAGWDDYEDVAVSAWNRRAPSEAVGLLREVLAWLEDKRMGTINYMEGTAFYEDKDEQTAKIRRFLAAQEGT